ncbi:hypothetical protein GM418_09060 [Maribellus comscasis]|uniref:Uncharacterized protein n=1 Tax=Maribellus comscasis TaxID=2681766 RepID=A0A6I6JXE8_9BACT|nr:hypothetical protein [Maribellus comscasis]QGY43803.1 hypothetical protein GM418_09060 [Maribellus comscasis]
MENRTTVNYYYKIKVLLSPEDFNTVEEGLDYAPNNSLEAFYHIIVAGYSAEFALANYRNLYEYVTEKSITYSNALVSYAFYPGMDAGMYVTKTQWYELN